MPNIIIHLPVSLEHVRVERLVTIRYILECDRIWLKPCPSGADPDLTLGGRQCTESCLLTGVQREKLPTYQAAPSGASGLGGGKCPVAPLEPRLFWRSLLLVVKAWNFA